MGEPNTYENCKPNYISPSLEWEDGGRKEWKEGRKEAVCMYSVVCKKKHAAVGLLGLFSEAGCFLSFEDYPAFSFSIPMLPQSAPIRVMVATFISIPDSAEYLASQLLGLKLLKTWILTKRDHKFVALIDSIGFFPKVW